VIALPGGEAVKNSSHLTTMSSTLGKLCKSYFSTFDTLTSDGPKALNMDSLSAWMHIGPRSWKMPISVAEYNGGINCVISRNTVSHLNSSAQNRYRKVAGNQKLTFSEIVITRIIYFSLVNTANAVYLSCRHPSLTPHHWQTVQKQCESFSLST
jgi:hypothetical protein